MPPIEWDKYGLSNEQIGEIQGTIDTDIASLKAKNDQLLVKQKQMQELRDENLRAAHAMNEELDELRAFKATIEAQSEPKGKPSEADQRHALEMKQLTQKLEKASSELQAISDKYRNESLANAMNNAMTGVNVKPVYRDAVAALFRGRVEWLDDTPVIDGVPLKESIEAWAATDTGKAFVAAADNSGAGSQGAAHRGNGATNIKSVKDFQSPGERVRFMREHPEQYQRLRRD